MIDAREACKIDKSLTLGSPRPGSLLTMNLSSWSKYSSPGGQFVSPNGTSGRGIQLKLPGVDCCVAVAIRFTVCRKGWVLCRDRGCALAIAGTGQPLLDPTRTSTYRVYAESCHVHITRHKHYHSTSWSWYILSWAERRRSATVAKLYPVVQFSEWPTVNSTTASSRVLFFPAAPSNCRKKSGRRKWANSGENCKWWAALLFTRASRVTTLTAHNHLQVPCYRDNYVALASRPSTIKLTWLPSTLSSPVTCSGIETNLVLYVW